MPEPQQIETDLLGFVRREIFAPNIELTPETDLVAAGFDSMSLVRVLLFIETTYGLWIPEKEITGETLSNLRSLAAAVCRLLHER
jgi:acyl carrier protein